MDVTSVDRENLLNGKAYERQTTCQLCVAGVAALYSAVQLLSFRPSRFGTIWLQRQILTLTLYCTHYFIARRQIRCYRTVELCSRGLILGRTCYCWLCIIVCNTVSSLCSAIHATCVSSNYSLSCFNWIV